MLNLRPNQASRWNSMKVETMPFTLLKRLRAAQLPLMIEDQEDIDKLVILKASELVEAAIPKMRRPSGLHRYDDPAVVLRVTDKGRAPMRAVSG